MKKLFYYLSIIFVVVTITSCSTNINLQSEQFEKEVLLRKEIFDRKLDEKFNIKKSDYKEFVDNLIFDEKGNVIGAIYDKIEKGLDDDSSNKFWNNFKMKVRKTDKENIHKRGTDLIDPSGFRSSPIVFEGYKPKRGSCKANSRWICVIREY